MGKKRLILTGWKHPDYALAAAIALRQFGEKTPLLGMSRRRLPEFLEEVEGYTEIVILGVSRAGERVVGGSSKVCQLIESSSCTVGGQIKLPVFMPDKISCFRHCS